jgi:hypothetical protein
MPEAMSVKTEARWGRAGRWGLALLALHLALLLLPPIPPFHNGSSMPGFALSLAVAALLAVEVWHRATALIAAWRRWATPRRRALVVALALAVVAFALAFRATATPLFGRFSREEGLWEPLTLVCCLAGAIFLWRASATLDPDERKPWRLLAAFYVWLAAEELDYFGIFGELIHYIRGEYAGALHDVIRLTAVGIMGPAAWAVLLAVLTVLALVLWRAGYLRPAWIAERIADPRLGWAIAGFALLWSAAAEEAHLFGWTMAVPTPEEAIELAGALLLAVYALEEAATIHVARAASARRPRMPPAPAGRSREST